MISFLVSLVIVFASMLNIIPNNEELRMVEKSLPVPVPRIASFSPLLLSGSEELGFYPRLPFNEDAGIIEQSAGDLPAALPLRAKDIQSPLELEVGSALAIDTSTKAVLYSLREEEPRVLASLTKLATALIVSERFSDWQESQVEILPSDQVHGESVKLSEGDRVSMKDLFYSTLVASANNAALALVRGSGISEDEAVALMNAKAKDFGLLDTQFVDVTGLSPGNISTARDFAIFTSHAFGKKDIFTAVSTKRYEFETLSGVKRTIITTNRLLDRDVVIAGKTGYTEEAGYNFVALSRQGTRTILTLVFGAESLEGRFTETEKLIRWVKENYDGWE